MGNKNEVSNRFIEAYEKLLSEGCVTDKKTFAAKIGISPSMVTEIYKGRSSVGTTAIQNIVLSYNVSPEWLLTGNGPMLKSLSEDSPANPEPIVSYDPNIGVPYFDVDFTAGFNLIFNDQTVNPTANIVVYGFERASVWCNVTGDSMYPKICHGDMIALRECRPDDVLYGEIYAVVLDNIRTVKILRKAKDPTMLRFIPINTEKYDEQEFEKSRIIRIFEVLGNISRFI